MQHETSVFMQDSVVKLAQRNRGAGQCANTPGATQEVQAPMRSNDTVGDPVHIPVRSRKHPNLHALVDAQDAESVSRYTWYALILPRATYAQANDGGKWLYLHRLVTAAPKGMVVDHVNHDGLDNRRDNLRVCTDAQNKMNRAGAQSNSSTGFIGVEAKRSKFSAYIKVDGKKRSLGVFATAEQAAQARDEAAKEHYGEFAGLNFPERREDAAA